MVSWQHLVSYAFLKAIAELKAEHKRYWLGFVWWLFEPLLQLLTLYCIFGLFLQRNTSGYVPFLLVGIVVWKGVSSLILHSAPAVMHHRDVLMQSTLREWVFPVAAVIADGAKIVGVLLVLFLGIAFYSGVNIWWVTLPILFVCLVVFASGIGLFLASIMPLIPDLRFIVESLLQVGFWAAGVFFSAKELPTVLQPIFYANPAACIVTNFRRVLLEGTAPDIFFACYPFLVGCVAGGIGLGIMHRLRGEYVKL